MIANRISSAGRGNEGGALPSCRDSFTLIELLLVVAIVSLLASLLLPALGKARERAYSAHCQFNMKQIAIALLAYGVDFQDYYPACWNSSPCPDLDRYAQEASKLSDAEWATNQAMFSGGSGGRGWVVPLWPYYRSLPLFICPADPERRATSDQRPTPGPTAPYEAYYGAPKQSYFLNEAVIHHGDAGWFTDWSPRQLNFFYDSQCRPGVGSWNCPVPMNGVLAAHGGSASDFVWMYCGIRRGITAQWGGFYGAFGGGRIVDLGGPTYSYVYGSSTARVMEWHPKTGGTTSGWDWPDGGSNYLFMDGHVENRMKFPSQREVACHSNP